MRWRRRKPREDEVERELRSDLELEAAELEESGLAPEQARGTARRALGNATLLQEEIRAMSRWRAIEQLSQDIRYALRLLRKTPSTTAVLMVTFAVGLGMNSAVFTVVNGVMLRSLPYREPDRLVSLCEELGKQEPAEVSASGTTLGVSKSPRRITVAPANLVEYRKRSRSFSGLAGFALSPMNLTGYEVPERIWGERVTANFFPVLGVEPALGRGFLPEEEAGNGDGRIVITDEFWRRRMQADPAVLGRMVTLDGNGYQVVGVLPRGFESPHQFGMADRIEFYVPAAFPAAVLRNHGQHLIGVVGRLKPGVERPAAQSELDAISSALAEEYPDSNRGVRAVIADLRETIVRDVSTALIVLLAATGLVVLIACVNVANLLLVRSIRRRHETSVRLALGASRARIIRQLLVESLAIALGGCGAGLALGAVLTRLMLSIAPATLPRMEGVHFDWRVFCVSAALAVATGLVCGIVPALQASRACPGESLKSTQRSGTDRSQVRWRTVLTVAEIALSMVLLIASGLVIKSFVKVLGVDLGFQPDRVLAMNINLPQVRYRTPGQRLQFFEQLEARVRSIAGISSVAFANRMPLRGGWGGGVVVDGGRERDIDLQAVSNGYFETLGIPLLRGRGLQAEDRGGHPYVALVNQAFARAFFGNEDPVGRRFRRSADAPWITIVGLVNDIRRGGKTAEMRPQAYLPAAQTEIYPVQLADFAVRTSRDPRALGTSIQRQVWALDKDLPVTNVRTMDEIISASVAERRFQTLLLTLFAAVAVILAVIGIFGVLSYAVSQRTAELGIRMALGARPQQIVALVLREASPLIVSGILLGLAGAFAATRYLQSLLFGIEAYDLWTYLGSAGLLGVVAVAAAVVPARRGSRTDPLHALRYE